MKFTSIRIIITSIIIMDYHNGNLISCYSYLESRINQTPKKTFNLFGSDISIEISIFFLLTELFNFNFCWSYLWPTVVFQKYSCIFLKSIKVMTNGQTFIPLFSFSLSLCEMNLFCWFKILYILCLKFI